MDKKVLAGAVAAGLLVIPASHAAIDDAGMQYTSAAEGFYGSLRVKLNSSETDAGKFTAHETNTLETAAKDADSTNVGASSSRLGVRGSVDLGGGLAANYRYEFGVNGDNGDAIGSTRLHQVGLSGGFGSLLFGTQWGLDYNYVWSVTDVMNVNSGGYAYTAERAGRQSNALTYYSPDFNGFDFGLGVVVAANADGSGGEADTVDAFKVGARYSFGGFTAAGTYVAMSGQSGYLDDVDADTTADDYQLKSDPKSFGVALGYGQDNWSVSYYYGDTDYGASVDDDHVSRIADDGSLLGDAHDPNVVGSEKIHSIAAQVSIDKATLRALYETKDSKLEGSRRDTDGTYWTVGAQYDLGSKSRVFAEFHGSEDDFGTETSVWEIGHRVDF